MPHDPEMLCFAGCSVAMGNGTAVKENQTSPWTNDEDGVAHIHKLIETEKGEWLLKYQNLLDRFITYKG